MEKAALTFLLLAGTLPRRKKGAFTEYGYIVESGDEWERQFEGREVPEEYRIMSYPQPERGEQDKAYMDAAETQQADAQAAEPQQPRPVVPHYPYFRKSPPKR